jgi:hypothetical protein
VLSSGEGFGEKALIEQKPRALTTAAYSHDLFLLILHKKDFALV